MDSLNLRQRILLNQPHIESVSGDIASFTTNMKAPLKECKVYFSPIQEGSGDPSPDNMRNIIGWNGVNLYKCKKNLVLESSIIDNSYIRGAVTQTGTEIGSVNKVSGYKCTDFIKVLPNTTYTITFTWINAAAAGLAFYSNAKVEDVISGIPMETMKKSPYTFTTPSNCNYIRFTSRYLDSFMGLVQGSTGLTEEIYDGTNIFTTWSDNIGTIYGGYIDLTKEELVAEYVTFEKKWNEYESNHTMTDVNRRRLLFPYERRTIDATKALCNIAPPVHNLQNKIHFYIAPENNYVYMFLPKDLDEETVIQIVSRIEEPIHYSLTPQQILTFKGENNIWSDTNGQTEVKFWTH